MEEFKAGDVVVLKSDFLNDSYNTLMTIDSINDMDKTAHCIWCFQGRFESIDFKLTSLIHFKEK